MKFKTSRILGGGVVGLWTPEIGDSVIGQYVKTQKIKHGEGVFIKEFDEETSDFKPELLIIPKSVTLDGINFEHNDFYRFTYEGDKDSTKFTFKVITCELLEVDNSEEVDLYTGEVN